jgi:hypothetical protein
MLLLTVANLLSGADSPRCSAVSATCRTAALAHECSSHNHAAVAARRRASEPPRGRRCCRRSCHAVRDVSGIAPAAFHRQRNTPNCGARPRTRFDVPRRRATAAAGMVCTPLVEGAPRRSPIRLRSYRLGDDANHTTPACGHPRGSQKCQKPRSCEIEKHGSCSRCRELEPTRRKDRHRDAMPAELMVDFN